MGLYLGQNKVKINLNDTTYCLNLFSTAPIINGTPLLSFEGYVLKDINALYLTTEEDQ